MNRTTVLLLLALLCCTLTFNAQNFTPYFAFGTNVTEAKLTDAGDSQVGFRMGLNAGAGVSMVLGKRWNMSLEFLYSENGLFRELEQLPPVELDKIKLKYIEVPLSFTYELIPNQFNTQLIYKQTIEGGVTIAHLYKHKITAVDDSDVSDAVLFGPNKPLFHLGTTSFLNETFAVNGRATASSFGKFTFAFRLMYYL